MQTVFTLTEFAMFNENAVCPNAEYPIPNTDSKKPNAIIPARHERSKRPATEKREKSRKPRKEGKERHKAEIFRLLRLQSKLRPSRSTW